MSSAWQPNSRFEKVEILVVDPDLSSREIVRMVLNNNGFREFRLGTAVADIRKQFGTKMPDLLICEAKLQDGDVCELIHGLRHHREGSNPFLPVMALAANPTPEMVHRIINSGADDLLPKPLSAGHLIERIKLLIRARKPFVVTSEYIGPDRRKASEREQKSTIPLIEVPNPLREKVSGERDVVANQRDIDDAIAEINLRKLERHAVQIGVLTDLIVPAYRQGAVDDNAREHLERLVYVAEDTSRRLVGTKYVHIAELCDSLLDVVNAIATSGAKPSDKDLKLLPHIAQALKLTFDVREDTAEIARKISETIRR